jgi:phytoene dehydrogenase-like protein
VPQGAYDVAIVGGGHNGVVAAGYLARAGLSVIVLERRAVVGGPCATVEFMPGYHASYSNSPGSLEPKIVPDLELARFGLRFTTANPSLVQPFDDGSCFHAWRERERVVEELRRYSDHDSAAYFTLFEYFHAFARTLEVSLFEPPPSLAEIASRLTTLEDEEAFGKIILGSIRDLLDDWLESDQVKALPAILAVMSNWVGPSTPGTPFQLLIRPLSLASVALDPSYDPRAQPLRGSTGLPVGGMGSIPRAMEGFCRGRGVVIRTNSAVTRILVGGERVKGIVLENGEEIAASIVLSNLHPRLTFLELIEPSHLAPQFRSQVEGIVTRGSAFKMVLALDGLPRIGNPRNQEEREAFARCQFRIAPSMDYIERAFADAQQGKPSRFPMMWGLTPSVADPSLAPPGKQIMSVNIWHAPHQLAGDRNWDVEREVFGKRCIEVLSAYIPNLKDIIRDYRFLSPRDIEEDLSLVASNITHGDMVPSNMFSLRPLAGWSQYRTPIRGLYLCGSSTWPGGYVSGLPGHNAGHQVLRDLRRKLLPAPAASG